MAYNDTWQMNCCIACGGPFEPTRDIIRKDRVGSRSLNYIEGKVVNNPTEWGVPRNTEVKLVTDPQDLHTVHLTNSLPILDEFFAGKLQTIWLNNDSPGFAWGSGALRPIGTPLPANVHGYFSIRIPNGHGGDAYRAVFWRRPAPVDGMGDLRNLIRQCIVRSNILAAPGDPRPTPRVLPDVNLLLSGCKACNDIMTQEGTMRHMLARNRASNMPLVPLQSIYRYDLNRDPTDPPVGAVTTAARAQDPNVGNRNNIRFSFQATIAYYIHRCLAPRPAVPANHMPFQLQYRQFDILFAYILLEVCGLLFERTFGINGGTELRKKPSYRYRGLAELYVSYIFWMLLVNDIPPGGGARIVDVSFPVFHRYWFCELLDTLALTHQAAAGSVEILDVIFGNALFAVGGVMAIGPNQRMVAPELVIGHMARSIAAFYTDILRPCFMRHMSGLDPEIPPVGAAPAVLQNIVAQSIARDMLIHRVGLDILTRHCETCTPRDIDSFLNRTGVHTVLKQWSDLLRSAPPKVDRLLHDWKDGWTLHEYENILHFLRQNPAQPKLSPPVAESIYLMCNVLELPTEPTNQDELNVLREAPKCSPYKAALRLELTGAFRDEED